MAVASPAAVSPAALAATTLHVVRVRRGNQPGSMARVWTVDAEGTLTPHFVKLGISDGQKTQITSRDLKEGESIVISATQPGSHDGIDRRQPRIRSSRSNTSAAARAARSRNR